MVEPLAPVAGNVFGFTVGAVGVVFELGGAATVTDMRTPMPLTGAYKDTRWLPIVASPGTLALRVIEPVALAVPVANTVGTDSITR